MANEAWPSMRAWMLLKDLEEDLYERDYADIQKLLDLFGVTEVIEAAWNWELRIHSDAPNLEFSYYKTTSTLNPETVAYICRMIRELVKRLGR